MPLKANISRGRRAAVVSLGIITLGSVLLLLFWDLRPQFFPANTHDVLGALPLALIAIAYLIYHWFRRPGAAEMFKALLLATAFLLWAANQLWPAAAQATLYNDLAIALFVLDVFFVIAGWPSSSPDESFGETWPEAAEECDRRGHGERRAPQ